MAKAKQDREQDREQDRAGTDGVPSMEDMARQYMDLWRDQLEGLATDPDINATLAQAMQMMNTGFANAAAMSAGVITNPAAAVNQVDKGDDDGTTRDRSRNNITEATGPAHRASDDVVRQLQNRISELEERVNQLESQSQKPSRRSAKKPQRPPA